MSVTTTPTAYTLLLVDDEPAIVAALRRTLRGRGYRIMGVTDPLDALRILDSDKIDVVISDIDMPQMTGLELVAKIRRAYPEVVRILLTGRGTLDAAVQAINDGEVHRFLTKPWSDEDLRATVERALARIEELRRSQIAGQAATRRSAMLEELAAEHPGIATVTRDSSGAYVVDERRVEALRRLLAPELVKLLDS